MIGIVSLNERARRQKRGAIRLVIGRFAHPFCCTQVESEPVKSETVQKKWQLYREQKIRAAIVIIIYKKYSYC